MTAPQFDRVALTLEWPARLTIEDLIAALEAAGARRVLVYRP